MRSIALCRAVCTIQARGNSGTPETRHWSTAAAKASWADSSARSKSPTRRIRVATMRPQSEGYRASTAAAVSADISDCRYVLIFFGAAMSILAGAARLTCGGENVRYLLLIYMEEHALNESERQHCYAESTELAHQLKANG